MVEGYFTELTFCSQSYTAYASQVPMWRLSMIT